jgi:LPS-assembly protein
MSHALRPDRRITAAVALRALAGVLLLAVALCTAGIGASAQGTQAGANSNPDEPGPAVLVADDVFVEGKTRLVARGNVEALYGDVRMQAKRIAYDRETDELTLDGPLVITQGKDVVVLGDAAQLDPGFTNGLLKGARLVLNQQVQLAAYQLNRVNGRYSQLYKASVTSCRVCNSKRPPLWQIRARRVIHDQLEHQLYFEDAQLRVMDVPIFYLPRLRLPDPTLKRANGFLIPNLTSKSVLGLGVKIPYFITLGEHRDLTVTPFLSANSKTLELRYRQAFRNGGIEFHGALSDDNLTSEPLRGYLFGRGAFDLKRDFKLRFDVELVSDKTYLVDYGYSAKDQLGSALAVTRARRDEFINAQIVHFRTLRVNESNATIPSIIGDLEYERRYFPKGVGGELLLSTALHSHFRYSQLDVDSADADNVTDGRDVTRLSAEALWRRDWTVGPGLRAGLQTGVAVDSFITANDAALPARAGEITPMLAFSLRWPWQKTSPFGVMHVIEPVVQLSWTGGNNPNVANDESTRVEFDEGNLLALSRFPAPDRRERGLQAAYGLSWSRFDPNGWQTNLTLGQITRDAADPAFSQTSGLRGTTSDLLVAGQIQSLKGLAFTGRALFDSGLDLAKADARASWQTKRAAVGASYVWLGADAMESRPSTVSEWSLDGLYRFSRHWSGSANVRYDIVSNKTAEAGVGLQYRNECVALDVSLSRRFTSSVILTPSTDFSFTIGLQGFSAKTRDASYTRKCSF